MERRPLAAVLTLLVAAACSGEPARLLPGEPLPSDWSADRTSGRAAVVWVFRTKDCLSCQALDYSLRRLQRTYNDRVALVAVHVGRDADAGVPAAFFASRRLHTAVAVDVSPRRFRRRYGDVTLPVLLLARGDTIAWSSAGPGEPRLTMPRIDSIFAAEIGPEPGSGDLSGGTGRVAGERHEGPSTRRSGS